MCATVVAVLQRLHYRQDGSSGLAIPQPRTSSQHRLRVLRSASSPHHRVFRRTGRHPGHGPDGGRGGGIRHGGVQHPGVHAVAGGAAHRPVPAEQRAVPQRPAAAHRPPHVGHHPRRGRLRHRLHRQVAPGRQPAGPFTPPGPRRQGFQFWAVGNCTHDYSNSLYYRDTPEPRYWDGYDAAAQTGMAIDYLKARDRNRPFALVLSWGPPHNPYRDLPALPGTLPVSRGRGAPQLPRPGA